MMEQILLRVTATSPPTIRGKRAQPGQGNVASSKIVLSQCPGDPDIHRECVGVSISEQSHAVCNLLANPLQVHQTLADLFGWQRAQLHQIKLATGDRSRGFQQVGGAKAHPAGSQFRFSGVSKAVGIRKRVPGGFPVALDAFTKSLAEQFGDLSDLDDLFGG